MNQHHFVTTALLGCAVCTSVFTLLSVGCKSPLDGSDELYARMRSGVVTSFEQRVQRLAVDAAAPVDPGPAGAPGQAWWSGQQAQSLGLSDRFSRVPLEALIAQALIHAPQIKVFSDIPLIREQGIKEANGRFVPRFFAEAAYEWTNDPVGSTLQTGGPNRFKQNEWAIEAGIRDRTESGAEVTLSQRITSTDNNSVFFTPDPQTQGRLVFSVVQPLLQGAGSDYNRGIIHIAEIDTKIARREFIRQAETQLMEISRAYWALYASRSNLLQLQAAVSASEALVEQIEGCADIDATEMVLARARAAMSDRRSRLIRAESSVRNAEDRLRTLVGDPTLIDQGRVEIIPIEPDDISAPAIDMAAVGRDALTYRAEIDQAFMQYQATLIRTQMAESEAENQLDFIFEAALAGLDGRRDVGGALDDEFSYGPSVLVGLRFEAPLGVDEDQGRLLRRRMESRQQLNQVVATIDTVLLDVTVAAREMQTSYNELVARHASLDAAETDLRLISDRWSGGMPDGMAGSEMLEMLLDAQWRKYEAEQTYANAVATLQAARVNLERSKGTLLQYESVQMFEQKDDEEGLRRLHLRVVDAEGNPITEGA